MINIITNVFTLIVSPMLLMAMAMAIAMPSLVLAISSIIFYILFSSILGFLNAFQLLQLWLRLRGRKNGVDNRQKHTVKVSLALPNEDELIAFGIALSCAKWASDGVFLCTKGGSSFMRIGLERIKPCGPCGKFYKIVTSSFHPHWFKCYAECGIWNCSSQSRQRLMCLLHLVWPQLLVIGILTETFLALLMNWDKDAHGLRELNIAVVSTDKYPMDRGLEILDALLLDARFYTSK
nr:hypothetical protein CFP56_22818 [Quercus suber]